MARKDEIRFPDKSFLLLISKGFFFNVHVSPVSLTIAMLLLVATSYQVTMTFGSSSKRKLGSLRQTLKPNSVKQSSTKLQITKLNRVINKSFMPGNFSDKIQHPKTLSFML